MKYFFFAFTVTEEVTRDARARVDENFILMRDAFDRKYFQFYEVSRRTQKRYPFLQHAVFMYVAVCGGERTFRLLVGIYCMLIHFPI